MSKHQATMPKQRSTLSKQRSTMLPKKTTMSNEFIVKFCPFDKVKTNSNRTCSICFDFRKDEIFWTLLPKQQHCLQKRQQCWSNIWLCRKNCSQIQTDYKLNDVKLQEVEEETDLGITVASILKPSSQCAKAAAKAMQVLGLIKRNFVLNDEEDFHLLFNDFVRPHLEYCMSVWCLIWEKILSVWRMFSAGQPSWSKVWSINRMKKHWICWEWELHL